MIFSDTSKTKYNVEVARVESEKEKLKLDYLTQIQNLSQKSSELNVRKQEKLQAVQAKYAPRP